MLQLPTGYARPLVGLALTLIVLGAAVLRLAGDDWDQGQHLNVDEYFVTKVTTRQVNWPAGSSLASLLDPAHSPLNPRAGGTVYPYGTLPVYLTKAVTSALSAVSGNSYFTSFNGTIAMGRTLAGLLDTLTTLLVFVLGLRLWGAGAGLGAAALYALAILPLHTSHFYISDAFMAFFLAAALAGSVLFAQTGRAWALAGAALAVGLAMACKLTAAPMLVLPLGAIAGWGLGDGRWRGWSRRRAVGIVLGLAVLVGVLTGLGLLIGDPFAVLDAPTYLAQVRDQAAIQSGADDQWFTRKYVGTWPVLYPWGQLMLLGVGPLVGVAGTVGLVVVAVHAWRGRRWPEALLLLGAAVYFASVGFLEAKWLRYFLPLVPYLCLFAVGGIWILDFRFWRPARRRHAQLQSEFHNYNQAPEPSPIRQSKIHNPRSKILIGVLILSALLGALAFTSIYRTEHTQVQASEWIYDHVPADSHIGIEATTTGLPLILPGRPAPDKTYQFVRMDPLADMPSAQEAATLYAELGQADYLVLDTTQAALTVPKLPWRYPVQIRYYDLLFAGQLGFTSVYTATSYPTLFGLAIPDDGGWVDASFMDSSHPPIHILHKTRTLSAGEWQALFADAIQQPSVAARHAP